MKNRSVFILLAAVASALFSVSVQAADVSQCDAALVKDTSSGSSSLKYDYRLATLVTEDEWRNRSQSAGAEATIYGVPFSASWSEQQDTVRQMMSSRNESLAVEAIRQYAVSSLSDNARRAYETCIKGLTNQPGLDLWVGKSSASVVTVFVHYQPAGADDHVGSTKLRWSGMKPARNNTFPKTIGPSRTLIVSVPRPKEGPEILNVQGDGAAQITIYPLPPAPKPAPRYRLTVNEIDDRFVCTINDQAASRFEVGFGTEDSWDLGQHLRPGKNKLQCQVSDLHPDNRFRPCWSYHFAVTRNDEPTPFIDHRRRSCGDGSQPPTPIAPEYLFF